MKRVLRWLFGGGELFRTLLDVGLVDTVAPAVMPVLIGAGIPLMPPGASTKLVLADQKTLRSGIIAGVCRSGRRRSGTLRQVRENEEVRRPKAATAETEAPVTTQLHSTR